MGYVQVEGRRFFVDPAYRYAEGGGKDRLVIYEEGDQRDTEGVSCGLTEVRHRAEQLLDGALVDATLPGTKSGFLREMEVAVDIDFEYYALHLGNSTAHILSIINMVNGLYAQVDLQLSVVNVRVFTDAATDPYETCNVYGQWCEMWSEWNLHRTHISRDLAHLFSGKRLYQNATTRVRGTSGEFGTVCNPSLAFSTSTPYREVGLVAHEMGHALNAQHIVENATYCPDSDCLVDCMPDQPCNVDACPDPDPAGGPVMCGAIQQPVTGFDQSFSDLNNFINGPGASCLSPVSTGPVYPWRDNATGNLAGTDLAYDYAMGYHFTPLVNGQITQLGGFFNGSKAVKLFNKATGTVLAQTTVSSANDWSYTPIFPVNVQAGTTYTVAIYMAGSGASYRNQIDLLPQTYGEIRIEGSTYVDTSTDPNARPTLSADKWMHGQADIVFVPNP